MTWAEIGTAILGEQNEGSEGQSARDYWKKAKTLIEKGGWKMF